LSALGRAPVIILVPTQPDANNQAPSTCQPKRAWPVALGFVCGFSYFLDVGCWMLEFLRARDPFDLKLL
jgi:hypothetical protein